MAHHGATNKNCRTIAVFPSRETFVSNFSINIVSFPFQIWICYKAFEWASLKNEKKSILTHLDAVCCIRIFFSNHGIEWLLAFYLARCLCYVQWTNEPLRFTMSIEECFPITSVMYEWAVENKQRNFPYQCSPILSNQFFPMYYEMFYELRQKIYSNYMRSNQILYLGNFLFMFHFERMKC